MHSVPNCAPAGRLLCRIFIPIPGRMSNTSLPGISGICTPLRWPFMKFTSDPGKEIRIRILPDFSITGIWQASLRNTSARWDIRMSNWSASANTRLTAPGAISAAGSLRRQAVTVLRMISLFCGYDASCRHRCHSGLGSCPFSER